VIFHPEGRENVVRNFREGTMSTSGYVESIAWVQAKRKGPVKIKLLLAFLIGLLMCSPAILGLYWETILR
jgi:hypothetical protein